MKKLSLSTQRILAGIGLALCLLCTVNYYLDFKFFGGFDKQVMVLSFVVSGLYLILLGPTIDELREYRDGKRR